MQIPDRVSLLVVGGGITGLSTAITWAINNSTEQRSVLVIEKGKTVGGYVTSFRRQGYLFDTMQLIPDSSDVLNYLSIDIELKKFGFTHPDIHEILDVFAAFSGLPAERVSARVRDEFYIPVICPSLPIGKKTP